jgi:hypothetical protein
MMTLMILMIRNPIPSHTTLTMMVAFTPNPPPGGVGIPNGPPDDDDDDEDDSNNDNGIRDSACRRIPRGGRDLKGEVDPQEMDHYEEAPTHLQVEALAERLKPFVIFWPYLIIMAIAFSQNLQLFS